jgi:tetratricopeptide (TPR) repeat protein
LDKAVADFTGAIRLNPFLASAYNSRGNAWSLKMKYDEAIADYSEVIRLDDRFAPGAYRGRAGAWFFKKEYDKAIADYTEAIRLEPGFEKAYVNRSDAWYFKKQYGNVIADCTQALLLDPKDVSAYNNRAWVWATCPDDKVRDGKRAVASATRACELTNWEQPGNLGTLAAAYAESGDFEAAERWQDKALGLLKDDVDKEKGRARLAIYRARKPYRD